MAFFKRGDIVTVRDDLDTEKRYKSDGDAPGNDRCSVAYDMMKYAGKQMTIAEVQEIANFRGPKTRYHLTEDNGAWVWTDEMFSEYLDGYQVIFPDDTEYEAPSREELSALFGALW